MAEQNNPVNESKDTDVELTTEQLIQAKDQLNQSGEALSSAEPQFPPLDDDETVNSDAAKPNAPESAAPGDINPDIDVNDLEAILALGEEVFDLDIETAAGEESGGGFTLVDFERDAQETIATTNFQTTGLDDDASPIVTFTDDSLNNINATADGISDNSVPTLTITSSNDFTEDDGSAVEGAVVSTFETTDEDGDDVTVTLSDTINYEIVGNTVVLTEAGAALVNSGEELPAYTLTVNDGTADGDTVSDDPSVTTVNDIPTITITSSNDFTEDDGSAVEGAVVSTFETTDEDGDDVTVTLSDTINYEIVGNTVVLTEAGAALVNSGEELPAYTLTVNDGTADGDTVSDDPSVTTVNDIPTITITSSNDFTEDDGSAVESAVVSTFETTDEDGDDVTVTLSDTINYEIVGNTVVLTEAGAALVNSGEELPAYTLTVNDGTADGDTVSDDPSVTTVNDIPTITITSSNDFTEDDGSAVEGAVVSTFETTDEDGDDVTVTLSDTINYEIVGDTVVLTEAGAALVNSGEELPAYTLTVNDGTADGDIVSDDPSVTTVNDIPTITITSSNDFTEDDGSAVEGAVVSTFETTDEDGDDVTVTLSDTINYEIVGNTVVLTEAGAALVNSGEELPAYTLTVNDGTADGDTVSDDPSVTTVDDPTIVTSDTATTSEDTSVTIDVLANDTDADGVVSPVASVTDGDNGTVTINDDGTVTYTPNADFNGTDTFTYTNVDGNTETVTVTVDPVADDTVVVADSATTNEDTPITIDVVANDTDVDNGEVSPVDTVTQGANGALRLTMMAR